MSAAGEMPSITQVSHVPWPTEANVSHHQGFFVVRNPTALRNAKGQRNGNPLIPFAITFYNEWG